MPHAAQAAVRRTELGWLWRTLPLPSLAAHAEACSGGDRGETQHGTQQERATRVQPSWRGARETAWRSTAAAGQ
jgi:hypothetical protein